MKRTTAAFDTAYRIMSKPNINLPKYRHCHGYEGTGSLKQVGDVNLKSKLRGSMAMWAVELMFITLTSASFSFRAFLSSGRIRLTKKKGPMWLRILAMGGVHDLV